MCHLSGGKLLFPFFNSQGIRNMSEAWIAFTGVIVGSAISAGFTWFIEWRKSNSEEKTYLKRKKEEAYFSALSVLCDLASAKPDTPPRELTIKIDKIEAQLQFYGSNEIYEDFKDTSKRIKYFDPKKAKVESILDNCIKNDFSQKSDEPTPITFVLEFSKKIKSELNMPVD